jgi:hypothetical protein
MIGCSRPVKTTNTATGGVCRDGCLVLNIMYEVWFGKRLWGLAGDQCNNNHDKNTVPRSQHVLREHLSKGSKLVARWWRWTWRSGVTKALDGDHRWSRNRRFGPGQCPCFEEQERCPGRDGACVDQTGSTPQRHEDIEEGRRDREARFLARRRLGHGHMQRVLSMGRGQYSYPRWPNYSVGRRFCERRWQRGYYPRHRPPR